MLALLMAVAASSVADDNSAEVLALAGRGQTAQLKALLDKGAPLEATDRNGRTPLMLAAQHGHAETVKMLLAAGSKPEARDKSGYTAWGLTQFEPAGRGDHEPVLRLLPQPATPRLAIEAGWTPAKLVSSCFMDRERAVAQVEGYHLDVMVLEEVARFAASPAAKHLVEIVQGDKLGMTIPPPTVTGDATDVVALEVEPGAACAAQSADNLTLSISVRVFRARDRALLLDKTFGGGLKGLRVQAVSNPAQYQPVYQAWIKPEAGPIYWAVAAALARAPL